MKTRLVVLFKFPPIAVEGRDYTTGSIMGRRLIDVPFVPAEGMQFCITSKDDQFEDLDIHAIDVAWKIVEEEWDVLCKNNRTFESLQEANQMLKFFGFELTESL